MSASGAVWNGRFGAFAMAYVLLGVAAEELKKCVRSAASSQRNGRRRLEPEGSEVGAKGVGQVGPGERELDGRLEEAELVARVEALAVERDRVHRAAGAQCPERVGDRKSTRLNSSHVAISYAVFCLKKKNKKI